MKKFLPSLRWAWRVVPVGVLAGSASAFFLWALHEITLFRFAHPWLLYLLPVFGLIVGAVYHFWGKKTDGGNNLIIEEIHQPGGGVPVRMAPFVLFGTLLTHLGGGSAGREGTAVQMGGSLAAAWARLWRIPPAEQRILLLAGVAAGFGSVFGTPVAGAIFAMEVLVVGRLQYDALLPVLVASFLGDFTCSAWGAHHTAYHIAVGPVAHGWRDQGILFLKVSLAGGLFGLVGMSFARLTHAIQNYAKKWLHRPFLRPVLGGVLVIGLTFVAGTQDYLGLGVEAAHPGAVTIPSAFTLGGVETWSWLWKIIFTAVTLGFGFKGGEVTPLFFIGATLGHILGQGLHAPESLFAGLGFIAVFAAAAKTPLACTLLGIELFGGEHALLFALVCFTACQVGRGRHGIYPAQKRV